MNSTHVCYTIPPRPRRQSFSLPEPATQARPPQSSGDDLRRLALELVQHDPVLAHLLVRAGLRRASA